MERIDAILQDERFISGLKRIQELEAERIFCCHGLDHLLDVARIAWIIAMEQKLTIRKETIYAAALLHDLGRFRQYEEGIPHHLASAELAREILPDVGFGAEETEQIEEAIRLHGNSSQGNELTELLYRADKLSRNCFQCSVQEQCKWEPEKRNQTIRY